MTPVLMRARAELKARWRAWVSLTLMLGLFGGAVIAIAAGARRTDSAYTRFLAWSRAYDAGVARFPVGPNSPFGHIDLRAAARLPQVAEIARIRIYSGNGDVSTNVPLTRSAYTSINRPKILQGRMPRPNAADEIAVNWIQARNLGYHVGQTVPFQYAVAARDRARFSTGFRTLRMHVVGIEADAGEFPPALGNTPAFLASHAFDRKSHAVLDAAQALLVRLRHGFADLPAFVRGAHRLVGHKLLFVLRQDASAKNVDRSLHLQAIALWLLAGLTALVTLLVFGQTLARQTTLESTENGTLGSLGMTRSQLVGVAALRLGTIALAGAAVSVLVAALASPLFPTGLARVAEPHEGFRLDASALGLGALGVLAVMFVLSAVPAWRAATFAAERTETERPSAIAGAVSRAGAPATASTGVRMALERGRGRTAIPVRTAIAGVTVGIAALAAALTFGASLTHLLGTPRLYGLTWDVQIGTNSGLLAPKDTRELIGAIKDAPGVAAYGVGTVGLGLTVDGIAADGVAVFNRPGAVLPPMVSGHAPAKRGEIALGSKTLDQLHKRIGETVHVSVFGSPPKPMRVVGEAVIPPVGDVGQFGQGALIDYSSAGYLVSGAPSADTLIVRTVPAADPTTVGRNIARAVPARLQPYVEIPSKPNDLVNFGRVQNFPLYLAGLVALMAAATLAHVLVTSIRRRRRDLAILRTLGFQRGQLTWTVAWQATTLAFAALLIGLPVGIAGGRWIWTSFADQLGIVPSPAVPLAAVLVTVPATLLLANLIAYLPGRAAGRVRAATVLRTE
jgi:ABC-type lipoprotein release transport system permease subunit